MIPPVKRDQLNTPASAKARREAERLATLEYLRAVRPGVDHVLQELVDEVRGAYGTDLCMVNLNLSDVQYFRAWSGELHPELAEARQDALEHSMCKYVVNTETPLIVRDFLATEEFREQHWHVNYGIRFYAGTPLITSDGHAIGTLCLLNTRSVAFGEEQIKVLGAFARAVVGRLELLGALEREQAAKEEEVQGKGHAVLLQREGVGRGRPREHYRAETGRRGFEGSEGSARDDPGSSGRRHHSLRRQRKVHVRQRRSEAHGAAGSRRHHLGYQPGGVGGGTLHRRPSRASKGMAYIQGSARRDDARQGRPH